MEKENNNNWPAPLDRIRSASIGLGKMVFGDSQYFEEFARRDSERKGYEDRLIGNLRERVDNLDQQDEIEDAKLRHPSARGYL